MRVHLPLACMMVLAIGLARAQAPAELPIEKCLPGSSCWARLQSVESLGARTADVAREVERLAKRDPELAILAQKLGVVHEQIWALNSAIEARGPVDLAEMKRVVDLLGELVASIAVRDERFTDYEPILAELRKLQSQAREAQEGLWTIAPGGLDKLAHSVDLLAQRLDSMPKAEPEQKDPDSVPAGRSAPKISVRDDLALVYGASAAFSIAVMAVPDPRIPRYRRSFDLNIEAAMRAMSAHGAHLDRFDFPWMSDQRRPCWYPDNAAQSAGSPPYACDRTGLKDLGLLTFRKDCRHAAPRKGDRLCPADAGEESTIRIIALYLVPERGTDGPDHHAAVAALKAAVRQLKRKASTTPGASTGGPREPEGGGEHALCPPSVETRASNQPAQGHSASPGPDQPATRPAAPADQASATASGEGDVAVGIGLIAPLASSSIGPWGVALAESGVQFKVSQWLSPSVTALGSSDLALDEVDCAAWPEPIEARGTAQQALSLACGDQVRLRRLKERFGRDIDLLSENSRYGDLASGGDLDVVARFSPGVWELQLQTVAAMGKTGSPGGRVLSRWEKRFARELLFDERDRGDEMPARYAHAVGARTQELAFEQVMQRYRASLIDARGAPTLIVASDVRDQLVVARAVRIAEPDAQLVFFDADELLAHPAYVGATRGALVMPAGRLVQCGADGTRHRFAKDEMALLFRALHVWLDPEQSFLDGEGCVPDGARADRSVEHRKHVRSAMIVTRSGLRAWGELAQLRWNEVLPKASAAWALALLFCWSAHCGQGYCDALRRRRIGMGTPIAVAVLLALVGLLGLAPPHDGWWSASVDHVGEGVSLALAWLMATLAMAVVVLTIHWGLFAEATRRSTMLLNPSALPTVPPVKTMLFVTGAGFTLHAIFSGFTFRGGIPGPSFTGEGWILHALPWIATALSALAAMGLGMAYRGWMLLRRDAALCDVRFSREFAHTWVGSTALPQYATPYLARHDPALDALAWQSRDMQGTVNRRRILASDIAALRTWLHGSITVAALGVFAVQVFPMAGNARLLQINLLVGLLGVGFVLMLLVSMARNELLSVLFTGRDRLEFGPRFVTLVATALLIGAGLLYLGIAPDGSDWYDDLFVPLLSWIRV